jgi:hypothetical protein
MFQGLVVVLSPVVRMVMVSADANPMRFGEKKYKGAAGGSV